MMMAALPGHGPPAAAVWAPGGPPIRAAAWALSMASVFSEVAVGDSKKA